MVGERGDSSFIPDDDLIDKITKGELEDWQLDLLLTSCDEAKDMYRPGALQEVFDEVFTDERREEMLAQADEDVEGRKVRYFRVMSWDGLRSLLETGVQNTDTYDDVGEKITEPQLRAYFLTYKKWLEKSKYNRESEFFPDEDPDSTVDIIKAVCTNASDEEVVEIMRCNDNKSIREFVQKYVDDGFVKMDHNWGSNNHMGFSPYLSISAGGVAYGTASFLEDDLRPVVELVIPKEDVRINGFRPEEDLEKEVLVRNLKREYIVKVYASVKEVEKKLSNDSSSAVGDYHKKLKEKMGEEEYNSSMRFHSFFDAWRSDTKVTDCIPASLRKEWYKEHDIFKKRH